jgi:hypothetical protein
MQALEARLAQMEQAFNTNTAAFSSGIQFLELQQEVLRRVAQETYNGGAQRKVIPGTDKIAWGEYLKEYIAELSASEAKKEEGASKARILLDSSDTDSPIIFGE